MSDPIADRLTALVRACRGRRVAVIGDLLAGGDPRARVASYNRLAEARLRP